MTARSVGVGGVCLAAFLLAGCRDGLVDPPGVDEPLLPALAGFWEGEYVGVLTSVGGAPDTFSVAVRIRRVVADFPFEGDVVRDDRPVHSCGLGFLEVGPDDRVAFDCAERSQLDSLLVLRVEARLDSAARTLTGVVRGGLSPRAAAYPLTLRRAAE